MTFPKIELHVHLEGTVRAHTLLQLARRNGVALPVHTAEGLAGLYEFTDFLHFLDGWTLTTSVLRTACRCGGRPAPQGARCDKATLATLHAIGEAARWSASELATENG